MSKGRLARDPCLNVVFGCAWHPAGTTVVGEVATKTGRARHGSCHRSAQSRLHKVSTVLRKLVRLRLRRTAGRFRQALRETELQLGSIRWLIGAQRQHFGVLGTSTAAKAEGREQVRQ